MQYLAHIIRRSRWEEKLPADPEDVAADAVTHDLKTLGQTLSVWRCDTTEDEMREVALAFACTMREPDPIDLVLLDVGALKSADIPMKNTPGNTLIADLNSRHVDLAELTLTRLVVIARHIAENVRSGTHCREFRKKEVRDIVAKAVQEGRVRAQQLKKEWQDEIKGSNVARLL